MNQQEQMKQLIRKEIQSISSLEDRITMKALMEGVFLTLYEKNEQMYQQLEERVMNELAYDVNKYLIKTGMAERKFLDLTHHFMTVMRDEDLNDHELMIRTIRTTIESKGRCYLGTVFFQCDFLEIKNILESSDIIQGEIETTQWYPAQLVLELNTDYLKKIEHLYHLFMKNGIPWQTVNCPYLFKMIDVYAVDISNSSQDTDTIKSFRLNSDKLSSIVRYDMVPIWNVWHLKLSSTVFPVAAIDHKNYEHTISISNYGSDYIYLVEEDTGIASIRQNDQNLFITCMRDDIRKWDVYSIRNGEEGRITQYPYPVMANQRKDGFTERLQKRAGRVVRTRAELERFICGFGLDEYLKYQGCELIENKEQPLETYSMNFFMQDEIRKDKRDTKLNLIFLPGDKDNWLLRDLMSFIVSEVQELYPEYECGGCLR